MNRSASRTQGETQTARRTRLSTKVSACDAFSLVTHGQLFTTISFLAGILYIPKLNKCLAVTNQASTKPPYYVKAVSKSTLLSLAL